MANSSVTADLRKRWEALNNLVSDLPPVSEWTFSGGPLIDDFMVRLDEYSVATPADLVTYDVALHTSKLERALPLAEDIFSPHSEAGAAYDMSDEVLVQAQMLAYKKPDEAFALVESLPPGATLSPLLAAFLVELYRYHKPAIDWAMSARAKTRYSLMASTVWGFVHNDESIRMEVVRKWPQRT